MSVTTILGIRFITGTATDIVTASLSGGLVVIPSAPVLVRMNEDAAHREALLKSELAITDSGLMVLLWRLLTGEKPERVSGLAYLKLLLERLKPSNGHTSATTVLWIMPGLAARDRNLLWLQSNGYETTQADCYVAPMYPAAGSLVDAALLEWVRLRRPQHIIICLGGGVQERLGYFLKKELASSDHPLTTNPQIQKPNRYRPGIHCVGAAIGFLSGDQVNIPPWADRLFLGWFMRCLSRPKLYMPRYWHALRLIPLLWRYRDKAPPINGHL